MSRSTRYRGRRGRQRALIALGVILLVVLLAAGVAFIFLRPYFSITEEGMLISLPFWGNEPSVPSPEPEEPPLEDIKIVIEASPTPSPSPSPTPTPTPTPTVPTALRAVYLPQSGFTVNKLAEIVSMCEQGTVDTVVLEVKSAKGIIALDTPELSAAMTALQGKANVVGYLSVLQDNTVVRNKETFAVKHQTGVNWYDNNENRWINPFREDTRSFVTDLITRCNDLPFDALLLDNLSFPPAGRQTVIGWGEYANASRTEAISTLAADLKAASTAPCWAVLQIDVCTGTQPNADNAAQDAAYFDSLFEEIFVKLPAEKTSEVYETILAANGTLAPLPMVELPTGDPAKIPLLLGRFDRYIAVMARF